VDFESYEEFEKHIDSTEYDRHWVFRAQPKGKKLKTTLERCCSKWGIDPAEASKIEKAMVRQFSRLSLDDKQLITENDTLFHLSLLRHHGAPVRLLDFSYSRYVAIYFGLELACDSAEQEKYGFSIWCIQEQELVRMAKKYYAQSQEFSQYVDSRNDIAERDDRTFEPLYYNNNYKCVIPESPAMLNQRQHLQQGLFLCPGDVNAPFMDNLLIPFGSQTNIDSIRELRCTLNRDELTNQFRKFFRMNMSRESLFPGLDGIASAMNYQPWHYREITYSIEEARKL
jgi:hypothetical protein